MPLCGFPGLWSVFDSKHLLQAILHVLRIALSLRPDYNRVVPV